MVIFAKESYGIVPIGSKNFEYIVHEVGSAGALDPLNQFGTAGWKAGTDCLILNEDFMLRYEFLVSD
jgi:N4-gp56 family major capsid protein